jgi:hypothetical protein
MRHYVTIHGPAHSIHGADSFRGGPGFTTAPGDAPKPKKSLPILAIPDPLKPRLKADKSDAQRELIDAYKQKNPGASADKIFADLTLRHPDVFNDDDPEDNGDNDPDDDGADDQPLKRNKKVSDMARRLTAHKEVVDHFQAAHPEMSIDRVYATLTRLNPEFFQD